MIGELITTGYTYHDGRVAINNAFSGTAIFNVVSAQTINIATIGGTTSITNLGIDASGNIVSGSSSSTSAFQTLIDNTTIDWDYSIGNNAVVILGGNRTLAISNIVDGASGTFIVKQDGAGARSLILPATSKIVNGGGGTILLSSAPNSEDILSFVYNSSTFYWNIGYNYN